MITKRFYQIQYLDENDKLIITEEIYEDLTSASNRIKELKSQNPNNTYSLRKVSVVVNQ